MINANKEYSSLLSERNGEKHTIDNITNWTWISTDWEAWDGPVRCWQNTHKEAYLKKVKKFDVCVQAGGNLGLYPRLFAEHFKTVFTFEPDPLNFHCLVNNCQKDNIIKIQGALGDEAKMIEIARLNYSNAGLHRVHNPDDPAHKPIKLIGPIPMFTLDSLNLPSCDLLQLDVEEHEYKVLLGAVKTLEKFKPVVCVERTNNQIVELLTSFGYEHFTGVEMDSIYYVP